MDPLAENIYSAVDIEVKDHMSDAYVNVHRGFVMAVGPGPRGNIELRMTVGDVSQLLGSIPFDNSYESGTELTVLVEDVLEELEDILVPHVFDEILLIDNTTSTSEEEVDESATIISNIPGPLQHVPGVVLTAASINALADFIIDTEKTFFENEHTAADVMDYVINLASDFIFYFTAWDENSIALVIDEDPHDEHVADHLATEDDTRVAKIYQNNALHEIRPVNTIKASGKTDNDGLYPVVELVHEGLYERANETVFPIVRGPEVVDSESVDGAVEQAKAELKRELDEASLGSIRCAPAPLLTPFSFLHAKPSCYPEVENDIDPLMWEVETVVHHISAQRNTDRWNRRLHETQLRVSLPTRENSMEVVRAEYETSEEAADSFGVRSAIKASAAPLAGGARRGFDWVT